MTNLPAFHIKANKESSQRVQHAREANNQASRLLEDIDALLQEEGQ